jgi:nitrate/nitrite-specific signal transduction histidine kinase
MSERTEKIGGVFSLNSAPGQGTQITVEVAEKEASVMETGMQHREEMPAA